MIHIVETEAKHLPFVEKLIDDSFGKAYAQTKNLTDKNNIAFTALDKDEVVGFALGKELSSEKLAALYPQSKLSAGKYSGKKALLDLIVVNPVYQGKGIGLALFEKRWSAIEEKGFQHAFLFHWVRKKQEEPFVAKQYNFQKIELIPNYWTKESLTKGYTCPECPDSPPCICKCVVYHSFLS